MSSSSGSGTPSGRSSSSTPISSSVRRISPRAGPDSVDSEDRRARLPAPGRDREEMLRRLEREAVLLALAFYLDANEVDPEDNVEKRLAASVAPTRVTIHDIGREYNLRLDFE